MDLKAFLRGNVRSDRFGHKYHVHMAFEVLRRTSFPTAAAAYSHALKLMAAQVGRPEAYHETITLAFLSIIGERSANSEHVDFDAFAEANPDLLDKSVIERWYAPERLSCDLARRTFLLPDQCR